MNYTTMTLEEITRTLKHFSKTQTEMLLVNLSCSEHISALKSVLFYLDVRAEKAFSEQLELEHAKNQKQREEFQKLLEAMQTYFPERVN